jgi:hypothetical protein
VLHEQIGQQGVRRTRHEDASSRDAHPVHAVDADADVHGALHAHGLIRGGGHDAIVRVMRGPKERHHSAAMRHFALRVGAERRYFPSGTEVRHALHALARKLGGEGSPDRGPVHVHRDIHVCILQHWGEKPANG